MTSNPGMRLREFRQTLGLDQAQFAAQLSTTQTTISLIENGTRPASKTLIKKLNDRYSLNDTWLLYGKGAIYIDDDEYPAGNPFQSTPQEDIRRVDPDEYVAVPRFQIRATRAGGKPILEDATGENLAFTHTWLFKVGLRPEATGLIEVTDDGMLPGFPKGSLALVHFAENKVEDGYIYAVSQGTDVSVRRLVAKENGWVILCDHPNMEPEYVRGQAAEDLIVHGRVRACISKF